MLVNQLRVRGQRVVNPSILVPRNPQSSFNLKNRAKNFLLTYIRLTLILMMKIMSGGGKLPRLTLFKLTLLFRPKKFQDKV